MKLKGFLTALSLGVCLVFLAACQPTSVQTNQSATTNTAAEEPVNTAAIETELLRIENDWPRVVKERDVAAVRRVEADDVVVIYPDGTLGDKNQDIKDIESGALTADSWEMADLKVHVIDKDAAFVSGRSIVKNGKYKMPDGKSIDISGEYRFIDTFARRNGEWKLVAGAGVPVRQPGAAASPSPAASPATKASPAAAASPTARTSPAMKASPAATP